MSVFLTREIPLSQPLAEDVLKELQSLPGLVSAGVTPDRSALTVRYDLSTVCIEEILTWLRHRGVHPRTHARGVLARALIRIVESHAL
jgi:hypothetical protein